MASNQTRSGLKPSEERLPFQISTSDVEQYLQDKVNTAVKLFNDKTKSNLKPADVKVCTVEPGSKFVPFTVLLPLSVLKGNNKKQNNVNPIFDIEDSSDGTALKDIYFDVFSGYVFTRADESAFFSEDWRHARGVSRNTAPLLKSMRLPKVNKLNHGELSMVSFLIDPIRIFHDMLMIDGQPPTFRVEISGWKKVRSGEFIYDVKRCLNKKGNKRRDNVADELNRKMRGNFR